MNPTELNPSNQSQPITAAEIEKMSLDEIASKDLDTLVGQTPPVETINDITRDEKLEEIQSQLQMVLKLESKFDSAKETRPPVDIENDPNVAVLRHSETPEATPSVVEKTEKPKTRLAINFANAKK